MIEIKELEEKNEFIVNVNELNNFFTRESIINLWKILCTNNILSKYKNECVIIYVKLNINIIVLNSIINYCIINKIGLIIYYIDNDNNIITNQEIFIKRRSENKCLKKVIE